MISNRFDDIRPYYDSEVPEALQRIAESPLFAIIASFVFPELDTQTAREKLIATRDTYRFQHQIMHRVNQRIIDTSITEMTFGGVENIANDKGYLFVSNHRDIMLDASLLQNILMDHDLPTNQITFGANLMCNELVIDIGKSNKMFRVERPSSNLRDFYRASVHLSEYMRHIITEQGESAWIAQRNGRTKDGVDRTDQGIINMFRMSCPKSNINSIADLNITPIAVSYEWEPCCVQKVCELYISRRQTYVKRENEDLESILSGITGHKGRVHFEICAPLTEEEIAPYADLTSNEFNKTIAGIIDQRVCSSYRLWPNNYIAHDMLSHSDRYASHYTAEEQQRFLTYVEECEAKIDPQFNREEVRELLLGIYAYAVDSKELFKR